MKHLKIKQLNELGFKKLRSHDWGKNKVLLHEKGNIQIETTFTQKREILSQEMYIANIEVNFDVDELKSLIEILNK